MKKKVTYEGIEYTITFKSFGYSDSRFVVNGESSSYYSPNDKLTNIDLFKKLAERSIKEYIDRHKAENEFKNWDGKL